MRETRSQVGAKNHEEGVTLHFCYLENGIGEFTARPTSAKCTTCEKTKNKKSTIGVEYSFFAKDLQRPLFISRGE